MYFATKTAVDLFNEYRLDYEAALEPCVMCLIDRCPEDERDRLDALLEDYMLNHARSAPYSPVQQRRQMEKLQPLFDRAMADPAVVASEDQREAQWRDTSWLRKRWLGAKWRWFMLRLRAGGLGRRKPWE